MPLISSTDYARFYNQGENEFSSEKPFLVDRVSLNLLDGVPNYQLPDYTVSIRRVTYLGWKLDPLPQRNFREVFQSSPQKGRPFWYIYNNVVAAQIQLFPSPFGNTPSVTNVWDIDIPIGCIVEFYRATDNNTFTIPPYLRQQMLKQYLAKRIAMVDGASQSNKQLSYFSQKWNEKKQELASHLDDLYVRPRKFMTSEVVSSNYFPGEPILPLNQFGISVDEGY